VRARDIPLIFSNRPIFTKPDVEAGAVGDHPKAVLCNFLVSNDVMADLRACKAGALLCYPKIVIDKVCKVV
jgi:hypothetical protein